MSTTTFFITGATGYIGGTVLERFLSHPSAASWSFNALVRSNDKAEKLKAFGITPVIGDLDNSDIVEEAASKADVVLDIANSDNLGSTQAILKGLMKRFEATGKAPILIHVSGSAVVLTNALGEDVAAEIFDDMDSDRIEALPPTALHRNVDLEIVNADKEGYVKSYIIVAPQVYGLAKTRFVDVGIQHSQSFIIPNLIKLALARGEVGIFGAGKNVWDNVHVNELVDAFAVLYDAIVEGTNPALGHGREGYYFASNGEVSAYDIGKAIGSVLFKLEKVKSPEPTKFTQEELDKFFGPIAYVFGATTRTVSNRTKALGWNPKKTSKDLLDSVVLDVESLLA